MSPGPLDRRRYAGGVPAFGQDLDRAAAYLVRVARAAARTTDPGRAHLLRRLRDRAISAMLKIRLAPHEPSYRS